MPFLLFQTNTASYACSKCGATFRRKHNMEVHEAQHSGIYKYHCPYCGKGTSATTNLKLHMKTYHTGILGFVCMLCQKDCGTVHELTRHLAECTKTRDLDGHLNG